MLKFIQNNREITALLAVVLLFVLYSAAIFLIPICISFDTDEKRR